MKRAILVVVVIAVAGSAAGAIYMRFLWQAPLAEGLIQANGRIEGDHISVTTKFAGRVISLDAREGDTVSAGQIVARLDDTQVRAKVEQARQSVTALSQQLRAAELALEVLKSEVPLQISAAEADVTRAEAGVGQAKDGVSDQKIQNARLKRADRFDAATRYELERSGLALDVAEKEQTSAQSKLDQAQANVANARLGGDRIEAKKAEVESIRAQGEQAKAALAEAESVLADMTLRAPASGTITERVADLGEVVPAGGPVFDLVNLDELYLKVYVPEVQIGKLRLGLKARIFTDAFPEKHFDATVRYIASQAEFTPKEVQTTDERVKLVFAVKLYLDANPDHRLTPGLPADAVVRWKEDAPWAKPRW
ncbi:MAG: efflux RND transporter periplasmic adaptor subunit [Phycisphaerae bacterium]|nr:efflux RND transporter periplasmic adaptor subunit [Phycisphaerae bacterium]